MSKLIDLTGEVFGKLTVISRAQDKILPSGYKQVMWNCSCECGNTSVVSGKNLKGGSVRSCGCGMRQVKNNLVGKRFERLKVIEKVKGKILKSGFEQQTYKCICDCGNETIVSYSALMTGNTKSCGCLFKEDLIDRNTTHGMSSTKLYDVWKGMFQRCYNKYNKSYRYYGGKGIRICDEWKNDFQVFYEWAQLSGYKEGLEIDRIDGKGNYEPGNCKWSTRTEQMNNVSDNKIWEVNGVSHTQAEWSKLFDIDQDLVSGRLNAGWDLISALTAPKNYRYSKHGEYKDGKELFSRII